MTRSFCNSSFQNNCIHFHYFTLSTPSLLSYLFRLLVKEAYQYDLLASSGLYPYCNLINILCSKCLILGYVRMTKQTKEYNNSKLIYIPSLRAPTALLKHLMGLMPRWVSFSLRIAGRMATISSLFATFILKTSSTCK